MLSISIKPILRKISLLWYFNFEIIFSLLTQVTRGFAPPDLVLSGLFYEEKYFFSQIIIIIFDTYIVQINIQEDIIKCVLHIKIESKITIMLPIYNFEFTIKCKDVYYMKD